MLMQELVAYARRQVDQTPSFYAERPVRYVVDLDLRGRVSWRGMIDTETMAGGVARLAPEIQRAGNVLRPFLLSDHADYTFGPSPDDMGTDVRARARHDCYMDMLRRCAEETEYAAVLSVLRFLEQDPLSHIELPEDIAHNASITFRVEDEFPIDLPKVREFWAREHSIQGSESLQTQCLVCGRIRPALDRLRLKVKGVPGGQTSLLSANSTAFESYGLRASQVAPTCEACGEAMIKGLNHLLADESHRIRINKSVFVFWTREEMPFSFAEMLERPSSGQVRLILESAATGKWVSHLDEMPFYALSLTANQGRAVVRDWLDVTVGEAQRHLARWFRQQRIVGWDGQAQEPLGVFQLSGALVRKMQDLPPNAPQSLLNAALTGTPLPASLLHQAVHRNRAEQKLTFPRAAFIKLMLCSRAGTNHMEESMYSLNPDHPSSAYHCGRLLAELEAAQREAIPRAKTTIVDRYYGSASAAPATVFARLLRGAQPHLSKLKRDRPATGHALQQRIEEICASISTFPKTLPLSEQGVFALGYYHQRAYNRAAAAQHKAAHSENSDNAGDAPTV